VQGDSNRCPWRWTKQDIRNRITMRPKFRPIRVIHARHSIARPRAKACDPRFYLPQFEDRKSMRRGRQSICLTMFEKRSERAVMPCLDRHFAAGPQRNCDKSTADGLVPRYRRDHLDWDVDTIAHPKNVPRGKGNARAIDL